MCTIKNRNSQIIFTQTVWQKIKFRITIQKGSERSQPEKG